MTEDNPHIISEEEAKRKDCPYRRVTSVDPFCSGSRCMAWRWAYDLSDDEIAVEVYSTTHGYCGNVEP